MSAEKVNVLMVDDQPNNLLALESILESDELNLVKAESGTRALRQLLDQEFAVVLLDVQMPDLDGFETARLIRERDRSRHTPIIFLTALSRSETNMFRGYELGAVDYMFKPFHPEILRSKVNVFVELSRQRDALQRQALMLAQLSRQNELILNAAAEGILGVDVRGRTTFINRAAATMIGRDVQSVAGRDLHPFVHPTFPGVMTCPRDECRFLTLLRATGDREETEETFFRSDGVGFPVEVSAAPIHDEEGKRIGSVLTFRDVTEKRAAAAAAEAERRYHEAEAQNRAKDNFLATLSHELRTPMTSILGWVQFLRTGSSTEEELEEALRTIETSARLQAHLIDDMLDVSRIVLGKFQVDLLPVAIGDIVDVALTRARPVATERGVRLKWEIEERGAIIRADASRMQQVIGNLLANAIKFSREGGEVELCLRKAGDYLRISIRDYGVGIDPSFLPHVFERLRQAEHSASSAGLGLGLAIARHIVDLHHGEILAESEGKNHGATFTVILPTAEAWERRHGTRRDAGMSVAS